MPIIDPRVKIDVSGPEFDNIVQRLTNFVRTMGQNLNPRIMIVDGYGSNVKSLSTHLAGFGLPLQILAATDAPTAMARLQREPADLIIIDSCLRGKMDGFELCRALRSSNPDGHIPIILLLSSHLSLERSKGMAVGADLLLHRPVVKEELLKMVQLLLGWRFEESGNSRLAAPEDQPVRRLHSVI